MTTFRNTRAIIPASKIAMMMSIMRHKASIVRRIGNLLSQDRMDFLNAD
jgi:hypothetical protein